MWDETKRALDKLGVDQSAIHPHCHPGSRGNNSMTKRVSVNLGHNQTPIKSEPMAVESDSNPLGTADGRTKNAKLI